MHIVANQYTAQLFHIIIHHHIKCTQEQEYYAQYRQIIIFQLFLYVVYIIVYLAFYSTLILQHVFRITFSMYFCTFVASLYYLLIICIVL